MTKMTAGYVYAFYQHTIIEVGYYSIRVWEHHHISGLGILLYLKIAYGKFIKQ